MKNPWKLCNAGWDELLVLVILGLISLIIFIVGII